MSARAAALAALAVALCGPAARAEVSVRWLGVAGFSIEAGDAVLLHDPYFSRPGLWATIAGWYRPDEAVLGRLLEPGSPAPELARAREILIGHSHFDHLGDAPWIASRTGATLRGSLTSVSIARGYGLAEARALRADPGDRWEVGPFSVRVVESRHARVIAGRVPLEGEVTTPPEAPIHALSFKLGDARGYLVTHRPSGRRVYVISSAAVHEPALDALREEGLQVDLLLAAVQGRDPHFASALVESLRPAVVVPHHYDDFFLPLDDPAAAAPSDAADLADFEREVGEAADALGLEVEVRTLALFETLRLD